MIEEWFRICKEWHRGMLVRYILATIYLNENDLCGEESGNNELIDPKVDVSYDDNQVTTGIELNDGVIILSICWLCDMVDTSMRYNGRVSACGVVILIVFEMRIKSIYRGSAGCNKRSTTNKDFITHQHRLSSGKIVKKILELFMEKEKLYFGLNDNVDNGCDDCNKAFRNKPSNCMDDDHRRDIDFGNTYCIGDKISLHAEYIEDKGVINTNRMALSDNDAASEGQDEFSWCKMWHRRALIWYRYCRSTRLDIPILGFVEKVPYVWWNIDMLFCSSID